MKISLVSESYEFDLSGESLALHALNLAVAGYGKAVIHYKDEFDNDLTLNTERDVLVITSQSMEDDLSTLHLWYLGHAREIADSLG